MNAAAHRTVDSDDASNPRSPALSIITGAYSFTVSTAESLTFGVPRQLSTHEHRQQLDHHHARVADSGRYPGVVQMIPGRPVPDVQQSRYQES